MNETETETPTPRTDEAYKIWHDTHHASEILNRMMKLERDLTAVTKQRDALAEALQKLADCDWVITVPNRMDAVREIANKALQSITPNKL